MAGRTRKNVLANVYSFYSEAELFFALSLFLFNNSESEITFPSQDLTGIGSKKESAANFEETNRSSFLAKNKLGRLLSGTNAMKNAEH